MVLYDRICQMLRYFLSSETYISVDELTKKFGISNRTLRNDIHAINEVIKTYDASITIKRNKGYFLKIKNQKTIISLTSLVETDVNQILDSPDKRINYLIIKLLYSCEYISQDKLADEVFVSTNTIINYLKTIRIILSKYDLTLHTKANLGYMIIGEETNKRQCIIDLITTNYQQYQLNFSLEQIKLLNDIDLNSIKQIVTEFNHQNNMHFSDYNLKNLILHIALSISRLQVSKSIDGQTNLEDKTTQNLLEPLVNWIEADFNVSFSNDEKNYIYSHYVSNTNELLNSQNNIEYVSNLVNNIIDFILESYHFDLRSDIILKQDLVHHLQSILNAKYLNTNRKNPLLNTIKNNYILSYEITETALQHVFSNEPFKLTDDEVGYISLHVGAAIERYFDSRYLRHKKIIIIYHEGYAISSFLSSKLMTLFKDTIEIVGKYPSNEINNICFDDVDLIISTISIKKTNKPILKVDIPLSRKDIENIAQAITTDDIHTIDKIRPFFDSELFISTKVKCKEEIIHELCILLKRQNYITDEFESSVLERENRVSTAMDGVIAIPHPLQMCSSTSKIAIAILQKPIQWSKKDQAQIILLLSLADDSKKYIEKLYDTFVEMMNNSTLQEKLFKTRTLEEFLEVLKEELR